jgi:hypothetical protein
MLSLSLMNVISSSLLKLKPYGLREDVISCTGVKLPFSLTKLKAFFNSKGLSTSF